MPDYSILGTEVNADPLGLGYSAMTNEQIAASLNTVNRTVPRIATIRDVRTYLSTQINGFGADQRSVLAMVQEFADAGTVRGGAAPGNVTAARRSACQMIWTMLRFGFAEDGFQVGNTNIRNQFIALGPDSGNGVGIFTTAQLTAIAALGEVLVSRAEEIGWTIRASTEDIARVRA
jgi:hypothetical protein